MQLSSAGRIAIIDDKYAEAEPLIRSLGKQGVPYVYYSGNVELLPDAPVKGIRFMFLDIELAGMEGQSNKNKASALTAILKKIIAPDNGPYVVVFWTTHDEVILQLKENLDASNISPVCYVEAEKQKFIGTDCDIAALAEHLGETLKDIGAFWLYVEWENILNESAKDFVNRFSQHAPRGAGWSDDTARLFYRLYKARVEKNDLVDELQKFRCACHLMNRSFLDDLQSKTDRHLHLPEGLSLSGGGATLDDEVNAKLNSSLFLTHHHLDKPHTGSVYISAERAIRDMLVAALFKQGHGPSKVKQCRIVITPECDLAQNKALMRGKDKVQQVVYGILYRKEKPTVKAELSRIQGGSARYCIGPIWFNDAVQFLVIHYSTLSFTGEAEFSGEPAFALSRDVTFDLQSKASNHINRLGEYLLR